MSSFTDANVLFPFLHTKENNQLKYFFRMLVLLKQLRKTAIKNYVKSNLEAPLNENQRIIPTDDQLITFTNERKIHFQTTEIADNVSTTDNKVALVSHI